MNVNKLKITSQIKKIVNLSNTDKYVDLIQSLSQKVQSGKEKKMANNPYIYNTKLFRDNGNNRSTGIILPFNACLNNKFRILVQFYLLKSY